MKHYLVVIDMQNGFVSGSLGSAAAQTIVPKVAEEILSGKYEEIIVTKDTHDESYFDTLEGRKLPVKHCVKNTPDWEIAPEIQAALEKSGKPVTVYEKPTFGSTEMCGELARSEKAAQGGEYTFVGLCTDICVVSNAVMLRAYLPNTVIRVIKAATAGTSEEAAAAALLTMNSCQIDIV